MLWPGQEEALHEIATWKTNLLISLWLLQFLIQIVFVFGNGAHSTYRQSFFLSQSILRVVLFSEGFANHLPPSDIWTSLVLGITFSSSKSRSLAGVGIMLPGKQLSLLAGAPFEANRSIYCFPSIAGESASTGKSGPVCL